MCGSVDSYLVEIRFIFINIYRDDAPVVLGNVKKAEILCKSNPTIIHFVVYRNHIHAWKDFNLVLFRLSLKTKTDIL